MTTIPYEHALRKIFIAVFLPSLALVIPAGIMSSRAFNRYYWNTPGNPDGIAIFCGIIPLFLSAFTAILILRHDSKNKEEETRWRGRFVCIADAAIAAGYLAVLLPIWIVEPIRLNEAADYAMLEAYATVFLIVNM